MYKPIVKLSPSRAKVLDSCSWLYYCKYILKIPDKGNLGNRIGDAAHAVLEILLNKSKYEQYIQNIVKNQELTPSINRYIDSRLKKSEFYSLDAVEKAKKYTLSALSNDFFLEGYKLDKPEIEFLIEKEYKIGGLIDVRATKKLENGKTKVIIRDYKTSKEKFNDKELKFNLQAYSYLLASLQEYPDMDLLESEVRFEFLQFPDDPTCVFKLSSLDELESYEEYLKYVQKNIDNFGPKNAKDYLASEMGYPKKEEGFCKNLVCGRAERPGQLKKDGSLMYHCSVKFKQEYYVLIDNEDKICYSSFDKSELEKKNRDNKYKLELKQYSGCPGHQKNNFKFYK